MASIKPRSGKADRTSARPIEVSRDGKAQTPDAGFLAIAKLKRAGGSLVMTVPAAARNLLGLIEGQEMAISVKGTQVIAEPMPMPEKVLKVRLPKYTLDELVAGYDADTPLNDDERDWMDAPPVGREVW